MHWNLWSEHQHWLVGKAWDLGRGSHATSKQFFSLEGDRNKTGYTQTQFGKANALNQREQFLFHPVSSGSGSYLFAHWEKLREIPGHTGVTENWTRTCVSTNDFTIGHRGFLWKPFQACLGEKFIVTLSVHVSHNNFLPDGSQCLGRNDSILVPCVIWGAFESYPHWHVYSPSPLSSWLGCRRPRLPASSLGTGVRWKWEDGTWEQNPLTSTLLLFPRSSTHPLFSSSMTLLEAYTVACPVRGAVWTAPTRDPSPSLSILPSHGLCPRTPAPCPGPLALAPSSAENALPEPFVEFMPPPALWPLFTSHLYGEAAFDHTKKKISPPHPSLHLFPL